MLSIIKKTKHVFFLSLLISINAMAAGKVAKQKNCRFIVEGLESPTIGQALTVTTQDSAELAAKISSVTKQSAIADFINQKECPNVVGASVEPGKAGTAAASTDPKKAQITPKSSLRAPKFGVSASGGTELYNTNFAFGSASEFGFFGYNALFMADYYLSISPKMQIPLSLGVSWYTADVPVGISNDNSEVTLTQTGMYVRVSSGIDFDITKNYRVMLTPFFDYGVSGSYKISGTKIPTSTYPFESSMRYGSLVGFEYRFAGGFKVGATGDLTLASFKLSNDYTLGTLSTSTTGSVMGYGGALYLGWNI